MLGVGLIKAYLLPSAEDTHDARAFRTGTDPTIEKLPNGGWKAHRKQC